ncbi:hypothetical protein GGE07_005415 [Sinorhizobium terangae]|nr:hypothetical protein [Sinorhizobium terangae]
MKHEIAKLMLSNGMEVVVIPDTRYPGAKAGSADEPPNPASLISWSI